MASNTHHLLTDLGDSDSSTSGYFPGGKVKVIYQGKLVTATILSHYDQELTVKWREVVMKRSLSQVVRVKAK